MSASRKSTLKPGAIVRIGLLALAAIVNGIAAFAPTDILGWEVPDGLSGIFAGACLWATFLAWSDRHD